jgi:hypothetical protein
MYAEQTFYERYDSPMVNTDQFILGHQAYQEILEELHQGQIVKTPSTQPPVLDRGTNSLGPVPYGTLLLGIAKDGLPVLLNLNEPKTGPLLIVGDRDTGKTNFLKSLALNIGINDHPADIQFGVLTNFLEEWSDLEASPDTMGVWPAYHRSAGDFLSRLIQWSEALPESKQYVILLIDDLDLMTNLNLITRHALHWVFDNGPEHHIWPVVTMNNRHLFENKKWLDFFHTYIFGSVSQLDKLIFATETPDNLVRLNPGNEFMAKIADSWIVFSITNP